MVVPISLPQREASQLPQQPSLIPQPMFQQSPRGNIASNISGPTLESSAPTPAYPLLVPSPHQGHGDWATPGMPYSVAQALHIHEEPPAEVGECNNSSKQFSSSLPQEQASADAGTEMTGTQNLPVSAEALRSPPQLLDGFTSEKGDTEGVSMGMNEPPGAGGTGDWPPNSAGDQTPGASDENDARDQTPGAGDENDARDQTPGAGDENNARDQTPGAGDENDARDQTPGAGDENDARDQTPGASDTGDLPPNDAGNQPPADGDEKNVRNQPPDTRDRSPNDAEDQTPGASGTGDWPPNDAGDTTPSAGADNDKCYTRDQPLVSMCTVVQSR